MFENINKYPRYIVIEESETTVKIAPDNAIATLYAKCYKDPKKKSISTNGKIVEVVI